MTAFPHQRRADRGLRPSVRTLRSRHGIAVEVSGDGVCRLAIHALAHNGPPRRLASILVGRA
jgi:hypothetical protein